MGGSAQVERVEGKEEEEEETGRNGINARSDEGRQRSFVSVCV